MDQLICSLNKGTVAESMQAIADLDQSDRGKFLTEFIDHPNARFGDNLAIACSYVVEKLVCKLATSETVRELMHTMQ